jgi:phosphate transport system substrate-binding protein
MIRALGVGLAAASVSAATATAASASSTISGAGSTLVAPLEAEWASAFEASNSNINVTYNPVGSGTGLKDIGNNLVDFAGSDAPLSASPTPCNGCLQMPWALTATGVGFHINGIKRLHLTGSVLAQIYLGKITNWDNRAIKRLQPKGVHLPNLQIQAFHRKDGSGDTYAFTNYLSDVSSSFRSQVGSATTVTFPTTPNATGNSGMVQALQSTNGSIAYVAVSYLIADWPRVAALKNAAGRYIVPNYSNIQDAAESGHLSSTNEVHIVDAPKRYKTAYPISTYTYVITRPNDAANGLVKDFIQYAITTGQSFGPRLGFVPIPKSVKNKDMSTLGSL